MTSLVLSIAALVGVAAALSSVEYVTRPRWSRLPAVRVRDRLSSRMFVRRAYLREFGAVAFAGLAAGAIGILRASTAGVLVPGVLAELGSTLIFFVGHRRRGEP